MMDARAHAIGERLADRPEPWIVDRLGMPPSQSGALRDDWVSRAGRAGFYRQARGITDPDIALGPRPGGGPEIRAAWDQAAHALELRGEEHDVRSASRTELEGKVHAYARAAATAPPDMSRQLGYHRRQAAGLERQAEQAEADGDAQLARDSRAAAAAEARQAAELGATQDARDVWDRDHDTQRLAARAACQELDRHGISPEPERHESENLTQWWQRFEAGPAADQAIGRQRQAAIDGGELWRLRLGKAAETRSNEANAQRVPRRAQLDSNVGPRPETDLGQRIDATIWWVQQAGARMTVGLDTEQQARQEYAARIAQETQHEIQAAHASPANRTPAQVEADYELEP
jgi:hypothetical protein